MYIPTFVFIFILFRIIILLLLLYPTHVIKLLRYNLGCYIMHFMFCALICYMIVCFVKDIHGKVYMEKEEHWGWKT